MSFGEEDHRGRDHFYHVLTRYQHDLSLMMLTSVTRPQ